MSSEAFKSMPWEGEDREIDGGWEREVSEDQPTAIDPRRHLHYVQISESGLVATFVGRGDYTDVGAVQANHPCPRNCAISYYEVTVLGASPVRPSICVGLAPASALLNRPPGVEPKSVGYRAEDGRRHCHKTKTAGGTSEPVNWEPFGPAYGQGDVVGCGILNSSRGIFFTRNGVFVGHAGKRQLLEERQLIRQEYLSPSALVSLVRSYLLHSGFEKTLRAFNRAVGKPKLAGRQEKGSSMHTTAAQMTSESAMEAETNEGDSATCATADSQSEEECQDGEAPTSSNKDEQEATLVTWPSVVPRRLSESLTQRAEIIQTIMEGQIPEATALIEKHYPLVLSPSDEVVEYLRPPRKDVASAVHCMQRKIAVLMDQIPPYLQKAVCECLGILAYEDPINSPLSHVFHPSRRSLTASAVNRCILTKHLHVTVWAPLELLVRHLLACRRVLRVLGGSRGPIPSSREYSHPLPLRQTIEALEAELL